MEILRDKTAGIVKVTQQKATTDIVQRYGLASAKTKNTPLTTAVKLGRDEGEALDTSKYPYSELVGSFLYLSVCTRADIAQAVGALARFMAKPTMTHWTAAKGIVRYLAGTIDHGIIFTRGGKNLLIGYCDADYAGDIDTRRSTTGYVFVLNGGVVSWSSKLQVTVAASTTEAEYMAAASAVKEALWLRKLLTDMGKHKAGPTVIKCDNQGALALLNNPIVTARSKHIDVLHHFARERVARNEVKFEYCRSDHMVADIMTKPLPEIKFRDCCQGMGLK